MWNDIDMYLQMQLPSWRNLLKWSSWCFWIGDFTVVGLLPHLCQWMSRIAPGEIQFVTVSFTPTAASYFNQKLALRIVDNPNRPLAGRDTVDGGNRAPPGRWCFFRWYLPMDLCQTASFTKPSKHSNKFPPEWIDPWPTAQESNCTWKAMVMACTWTLSLPPLSAWDQYYQEPRIACRSSFWSIQQSIPLRHPTAEKEQHYALQCVV